MKLFTLGRTYSNAGESVVFASRSESTMTDTAGVAHKLHRQRGYLSAEYVVVGGVTIDAYSYAGVNAEERRIEITKGKAEHSQCRPLVVPSVVWANGKAAFGLGDKIWFDIGGRCHAGIVTGIRITEGEGELDIQYKVCRTSVYLVWQSSVDLGHPCVREDYGWLGSKEIFVKHPEEE